MKQALWIRIIMSLSFAYARIVDDNGPLESLKQDSMKADGLVELDRGWLTGWSFILNNSIVTSQTQQGTELRLLCMEYGLWQMRNPIFNSKTLLCGMTRSESPNGKCIYL